MVRVEGCGTVDGPTGPPPVAQAEGASQQLSTSATVDKRRVLRTMATPMIAGSVIHRVPGRRMLAYMVWPVIAALAAAEAVAWFVWARRRRRRATRRERTVTT